MGRNKRFEGKRHYTTVPEECFQHMATQAEKTRLDVTQYLAQLIYADMEAKGVVATPVVEGSNPVSRATEGGSQGKVGQNDEILDEDGSVLF